MPATTAKPSNLPPRYSLPGLVLPAVLPTDAAALTALLHSVVAAHHDVKTQAMNHMQHMLEPFILARHRMFGASSEQSSAQGRLFDEAEVLAAGSDATQDVAALPPDTNAGSKAGTKPARGKRQRRHLLGAGDGQGERGGTLHLAAARAERAAGGEKRRRR